MRRQNRESLAARSNNRGGVSNAGQQLRYDYRVPRVEDERPRPTAREDPSVARGRKAWIERDKRRPSEEHRGGGDIGLTAPICQDRDGRSQLAGCESREGPRQ